MTEYKVYCVLCGCVIPVMEDVDRSLNIVCDRCFIELRPGNFSIELSPLSKQQEDVILEQARERDFEKKTLKGNNEF